MTTNLRPGPEISSLYAFGSVLYLVDKRDHFVPVSYKATKISYQSEFVPVSCKYSLGSCFGLDSCGIIFLFSSYLYINFLFLFPFILPFTLSDTMQKAFIGC